MSPKRLVLFDIDGTLLLGGPLWKECFIRSVVHHFPSVEFPNIPFGGKTDVQICREMLSASGLSLSEVEEKMRDIIAMYVLGAQEQVRTRVHEITVLPGVVELLNQLSTRDDVLVGLLTGNVRSGAMAKLGSVELEHYFKFGVFGDDHWDRYQLPPIAVDRAKQAFNREFKGKEVVIIGDTVHDVNCGKSIGVRSIAVGTGKNVSKEELLAEQPDFYFRDLSSTFDVIQAIVEDI